jgi:hypothetical protein
LGVDARMMFPLGLNTTVAMPEFFRPTYLPF